MIPPAPNCSRASSMSIRSSGTRTSAASEAPRRDRMADDRIIRVLEEIRDLQRQHMERYGEALRNQQESIRLQQAGLRRGGGGARGPPAPLREPAAPPSCPLPPPVPPPSVSPPP